MKTKSLLLGSAAALFAVTGARAADAVIIPEPEAVEYVRICEAAGTGYFYIPQGETCLKISGYARFQVDYTSTSKGANAGTMGNLANHALGGTNYVDYITATAGAGNAVPTWTFNNYTADDMAAGTTRSSLAFNPSGEVKFES